MHINAILFDADGVVQRPGSKWPQACLDVVGDSAKVDEFVDDVFAAEGRCLAGDEDFSAELSAVLSKWHRDGRDDAVLAGLNDIHPDDGVLARIAQLRERGLLCCLATNQQEHRTRHMSAVVGYRHVFDHEFYSCELGASKPDRAFFAAVLESLGLPPRQVLLIDDHEENVRGAQASGLRAALFERNAGVAALDELLRVHGVEF